MIYQSVSIQPVIARVIRNTKIQDTTYIMDIDEWIPEAMGLMQTRTVLRAKGPEPVEIVFHKGKLPCDLIHLVAVRHCGRRLVEGGSINKMVKDTGTIPYYNAEMGFITTSFQDGSAEIFYAAQPVDEDGLPLIPDNEDYKEALQYYCRAKMVGCGYKDPVFSEQLLMERFEKHAARAIGAIRYPSVDSMEQKVTTMVNFIPPQNYFDNFFRVDAAESVYGGGGSISSLPLVITTQGELQQARTEGCESAINTNMQVTPCRGPKGDKGDAGTSEVPDHFTLTANGTYHMAAGEVITGIVADCAVDFTLSVGSTAGGKDYVDSVFVGRPEISTMIYTRTARTIYFSGIVASTNFIILKSTYAF